MTRVRIATRGSDLALTQAEGVAGRVRQALGVETELVVVKTTGDRIRDVSLAKLGGKGLFVKEIEEALLEGRADVAVHSAKDLPADLPDALHLVAFPEREDPRDALVSRDPDARLDRLPTGARVGTGSVRRRAQLLALRPDLDVVPLRGNVPTRLQRLEDQALDAVVLACAGLERLGLAERICERIDPAKMLPAVCQGTLALEARAGDPLAADLAALDDPATSLSVAAERAFLSALEGDCSVPLAGFAEPSADALRVRGMLCSLDGARVAHCDFAESASEPGRAAMLGKEVASRVLASGGDAILRELRASEPA